MELALKKRDFNRERLEGFWLLEVVQKNVGDWKQHSFQPCQGNWLRYGI
jgi:hypothetical protein